MAALETEVRELLGKPAAVFMPSGTMAQQIALRIHADRRGRRVVAFHPTCHLELHEDKAYQRLHGLIGRPLGDGRELVTLADLEARPRAARRRSLIELPQREIGGRLPAWDDLVALVESARERGARRPPRWRPALGVRPFYGVRSSEIAGAVRHGLRVVLQGPRRAGGRDAPGRGRRDRRGARMAADATAGRCSQLWPYAAAGLAGLRLRLPRMAAYVEHARAIAAALAGIEGVEVVPDPPQTPMMHLHLRYDRGRGERRHPPPGDGGAAVDLGRFVTDGHARRATAWS